MRVVDYEVAVASDGSLAFASNRMGEFEIFTADADGGNPQRLTEGGGKDTPAWSPNGKEIAFVREDTDGADLFVIGRDGGAARRLTTNSLNDIHPFWSPDGQRLTFTRFRPDESGGDGRLDLYVIGVDGKGERRLKKGGSYGSLSPDGLRLIYWRYYSGNADITVADADGRNERRLTTDPAFDGWPSWSHDGKAIAFARQTGEDSDIFVYDFGAATETRLTYGRGRKTSPKWGVDDTHIYFDGMVGGAQGIWRIEVLTPEG